MSRGFLRLGLMAIKTATEELEEVQVAITSILNGAQSHSIGGRAMTKGDLGVLYQMRRELRPEAKREASGRTGPRGRGATPSW